MTFHIVTLFPEAFKAYTDVSIIGRAVRGKKIKIKFYNPREFTKDRHKRVDKKPYGGGPGMVLEAFSVLAAVLKAMAGRRKQSTKIIWLSPSGKQFDNKIAEKYAKKITDLIIICGRYEGIDARVLKIIRAQDKEVKIEKLSIGPYIVTGGELPAMILLDTISRRIPGVLGKIESVEENRIATSEVYTRPEILIYKDMKYRVPKILLSGHRAKIDEWKSNKKSK